MPEQIGEHLKQQELAAERDNKIKNAAIKVVEALDVEASLIRMPAVLALALISLEQAVKGSNALDRRFADTLARRCDELEAENKMLRQKLVEAGEGP